jgi:hypothetical protein
MERSDKRWGRGNARRHKETFEVEWYVHYLDCGDGLMGTDSYQRVYKLLAKCVV